MKLREATIDDVEAIVDLFLRCWKESYSEILPAEVRDSMNVEKARDLWSKSFSDNSLKTFLVLSGSEVSAVFRYGLARDLPDSGHLFSLYVDPSFAGQGLGRSIMENVMSMAKSDSYQRVTLWVFEKNRPARSLYEKFGFTPTGNTRITPSWGEVEIELSTPII